MTIQNTQIISPKNTAILIVLTGLVIALGLYFVPAYTLVGAIDGDENNRYDQAQEYFNGEEGYKPALAHDLFKESWEQEGDERALFELSRTSLVLGNFDDAIIYADKYLEFVPLDTRAEYNKGLAYGYERKFEKAEESFKKHIDSGNSRWAGYLDLAWTQFMQDKLDEAEATLEIALEIEENAWVLNSYGAVLHAQGKSENAVAYLESALEVTDSMTTSQWATAYSSNDDAKIEQDIDGFRQIVEANLNLAKGENASITSVNMGRVVEYIGGISPGGFSKGIVVSACAENCTSAPNACGEISTGTRNCNSGPGSGCSACSGATPPNPSHFGQDCSITNACGVQTTGTFLCSGQCNVGPAPLPETYGTPCQSEPNTCGQVGNGVIGCDGQCNAAAPPIESCSPGVLYGCTDENATNYNADASHDSGECRYVDDVVGCTDPSAINYNSAANVDNASCYFSTTVGCSDPNARNYIPNVANADDTQCVYGVSGCTNSSAANYNPLATVDDGQCNVAVCPDGYLHCGQSCVLPGTVVPSIQCSLDQDWEDDDNSCEQLFVLKSPNQPIYLRANPKDVGGGDPARCSLSNYQWAITGGANIVGNVVGNKRPTMTFPIYSGQDVIANFTADPAAKIFYRTVRVNASTDVPGCRTSPVTDSLKVQMLDINIVEE